MAEAQTTEKSVPPNRLCELCEEKEPSWNCSTCTEYSCDKCKKILLKSKASRNHKVTQLLDSEKCQHLDYEDKDRDVLKCTTLSREVTFMFCRHCSIPIYRDSLLSEAQQSHKLKKIEEVIEEKHGHLVKIINNADEKLSLMEGLIKSIGTSRITYPKENKKQVSEIKSRNVQLKAMIDKITNDSLNKLKKAEESQEEKLKNKEKGLETEISSLKKFINRCKDRLSQKNTELVKFVTDAEQHLKNYKPGDPPELVPPTFVTRDIHMDEMKSLFGDLELDEEKGSDYEGTIRVSGTSNVRLSGDTEVISTFDTRDGVSRIACVSDTQAWAGRLNQNNISLVTNDGTIIQTVQTKLNVKDIAVNKNNELLVAVFSYHNGSIILKLTPGGTLVDVYSSTDSYGIDSLTVTDNDEIIVYMYKYTPYTDYHTDWIIQLKPNGEVRRTIYQHGNSDKPNWYHINRCISSNRNGDIVVTRLGDRKAMDVFDNTGSKRFTYNGQGHGQRKNFDPRYVITDQYGHILISDRNNSVVHILDKDGQFLQCFVSSKHRLHYPTGMSIDPTGRLWICSDGNKKVTILKYI